MSLLSSSVSISRYRVTGKLPEAALEYVREALKQNAVRDIDNDPVEQSVGWTPLETPFQPDFEAASIVYGTAFVFSLRMDKKTVPAKILKKHLETAVAGRLAKTERNALSRMEKAELKEEVFRRLLVRMPAVPHIYDLVWHYETDDLWFFSNLKAANEALETLFTKSFKISIVRMFPYTAAEHLCDLKSHEKDVLMKLSAVPMQEGGGHA